LVWAVTVTVSLGGSATSTASPSKPVRLNPTGEPFDAGSSENSNSTWRVTGFRRTGFMVTITSSLRGSRFDRPSCWPNPPVTNIRVAVSTPKANSNSSKAAALAHRGRTG